MRRWEEVKFRKKPFKNDEDDSIEDEPAFLERVNNRLYFYSDVKTEKNLQLNKSIRELNGDLLNKQKDLNLDSPPNIFLHINSMGGYIFDGLSSADEILKSNIPVITIIDGCVASAATLMSIVGKKRLINKHAFMLIHQLSCEMWGEIRYHEQKDEMKNSENLMKIIKKLYSEHTKIPSKKLNDFLKHDVWWDAETCIKYGLVDEII